MSQLEGTYFHYGETSCLQPDLRLINETPLLLRTCVKVAILPLILDVIAVHQISMHWVIRCHVWLPVPIKLCYYRGVDNSLAQRGRKQANVSVRIAWITFGALPCRKKKMTARVSMLLKSRASLTCFRACFVPGRAKNLSPPLMSFSRIYRYLSRDSSSWTFVLSLW